MAQELQWSFTGLPGGSPLWLNSRKHLNLMATGSKAGDAIGVGYGSRQQYWKERTGLRKRPKPHPEAKMRMDHGIRWEDTALRLLCDGHLKGQHGPVLRPGLVISPRDPRTGATPDALLPELNAVVEVKCRFPDPERTQTVGGIQTYRDPFVPPSHLVQMMHEMHCTDTKNVFYVCLGVPAIAARNPNFKGRCPYKLVVQEYSFPKDLYEDRVWPRLVKFMDNVQTRTDPGRVPNGVGKALKDDLRKRWTPANSIEYTGVTPRIDNGFGVPWRVGRETL